eukprot:354547-Chlamydomonas_euryale.AAC.2
MVLKAEALVPEILEVWQTMRVASTSCDVVRDGKSGRHTPSTPSQNLIGSTKTAVATHLGGASESDTELLHPSAQSGWHSLAICSCNGMIQGETSPWERSD